MRNKYEQEIRLLKLELNSNYGTTIRSFHVIYSRINFLKQSINRLELRKNKIKNLLK